MANGARNLCRPKKQNELASAPLSAASIDDWRRSILAGKVFEPSELKEKAKAASNRLKLRLFQDGIFPVEPDKRH